MTARSIHERRPGIKAANLALVDIVVVRMKCGRVPGRLPVEIGGNVRPEARLAKKKMSGVGGQG